MADTADIDAGPSPDSGRATSRSTAIALIAIGIVFLLQLELVFNKSINWDEYFHFSQIHQSLRGEHVPWLQTPHVWLFGWVPSLSGDPMAHIQLIRLMILPFELLTALVIFDSTRRIAGRETGMICVLAYLTGGYIFLHGFALRADMIATGLLMAALWIAMWRPVRLLELAAFGLLGGLAFVTTIKAVFYAPVFLGVVILRRKEFRQFLAANRLPSMLALAAILLGIAALLASGGIDDIAALAASSWQRMFSAGLFPQANYLLEQFKFAIVLTAMAIAAPFVIFKQDGKRVDRLALTLFLLPLLTVVFYRNAYPYFFPFIFAPAMIAIAAVVKLTLVRFGMVTLVAVLLANGVILSFGELRAAKDHQETVQQGIREIFPDPVHYIDDVAIMSDYPRTVPMFASGWALESYRRKGEPLYELAIRRQPTPLLLRQGEALEKLDPEAGDEIALLPPDVFALADNYLQHWGQVYVAGKRIAAGSGATEIEILIPGPYTVEGEALEIEGQIRAPGEVVRLAKGKHAIVAPAQGEALLRYGNHLPRPSNPWPDGLIFTYY